MIQLVVNSVLLREISDRKLIRDYARFCYESEEDIIDDSKIKANLTEMLDWDANTYSGLYCSRFESIRERDWPKLIQTIKENSQEIKYISTPFVRKQKMEKLEKYKRELELKEDKRKEYFTDSNYQTKKKSSKSCTYNGREYKSRQECMYKENITKAELYRYLVLSGQINPDSPLAKKYIK